MTGRLVSPQSLSATGANKTSAESASTNNHNHSPLQLVPSTNMVAVQKSPIGLTNGKDFAVYVTSSSTESNERFGAVVKEGNY